MTYRTSSYSKPRRGKRRNTLNASTRKKLAGIGAVGGIATVMAPVAVQAIQSKNVQPITNAVMDVNTLKESAIRGIGGYAVGMAIGIIADKTGFKRPINKALKLIGMR